MMALIPWGQIFSILLKLIGFGLDRSKASAELKKQFYDFVDKMNEERLTSIKVKTSWEEIKKNLENKKE